MARLKGVFLDTSVLLGGTIDVGPSSRAAQAVMDAIAEGRVERPLTAWHCCLEYYAVATRLPEELRLPPSDALRLVEEEILGRFEVVDLPPREHLSLLQVSRRAAGRRRAALRRAHRRDREKLWRVRHRHRERPAFPVEPG
ncbi:MAG: PIN domain-containing protein [Holophagales bacterium]|nr:PIN domain-containing protein [Holophagales bacterium]